MTFNPDLARLTENLNAISGQVNRVLVVDNSSHDLQSIEVLASNYDNVEVRARDANGGIAVALNEVMAYADAHEAEWTLLLDQDSVAGEGLVAKLAKHIAAQVGIVCPDVEDRNVARSLVPSAEVQDVDGCITSGSLCNVAAWRAIGRYDENYFIDFVDFDYCLRLRLSGYRIIRNSAAVLLHELGNGRRYGPFIAYNHSAFRMQYMARDMMYYAKKHRRSAATLRVANSTPSRTLLKLLKKAVVVCLFEKKKLAKIVSLVRGTFSGFVVSIPSRDKSENVSC